MNVLAARYERPVCEDCFAMLWLCSAVAALFFLVCGLLASLPRQTPLSLRDESRMHLSFLSRSVSLISLSRSLDRTSDWIVFKASGDELIPDAGDERKTVSSQTRAVIVNKSVSVCLDSAGVRCTRLEGCTSVIVLRSAVSCCF